MADCFVKSKQNRYEIKWYFVWDERKRKIGDEIRRVMVPHRMGLCTFLGLLHGWSKRKIHIKTIDKIINTAKNGCVLRIVYENGLTLFLSVDSCFFAWIL